MGNMPRMTRTRTTASLRGNSGIGKPRGQSLILAVALVAALVRPTSAQTNEHPADDLAVRVADAVRALHTHYDTSGVAGLSAAVGVDGRLVWAGGVGYADLQHRVEAGSGTVSRIGSISKPVSAVAALALWDTGELDLDAPISTYLPEYPSRNAHITVRQLMSHTAGVRHYRGEEYLSNVAYSNISEPMAVFWEDSLLFEPGTDYGYSTYGWTVVSAAVEAADGHRTWLEILRDEVTGPLGLLSVQPEWQDSIIPNHASFYLLDGETASLSNAPEVDLSNKWAGGGLVATASDLVNFGLGLLRGEVLTGGARGEMWRRQTPEGERSYGLGWDVGEIDGHRAVSHSGVSPGATAMLFVLPDDGIVVAVLSNTSGGGHAGFAARRMIDALLVSE